MSCRRIGKLLPVVLALLLAGCRIQTALKPDIIVDIPLNPTQAVTVPPTEATLPETEPVTQTMPATEAATAAATTGEPERDATAPPPAQERPVKVTQLARRVSEELNRQRQSAGLEPLKDDAALCACADMRALEQTTHLGHTRPDGSSWESALGSHGYGFTRELICYGGDLAVMERWMETDRVRADILSDAAAVMGAAAYTVGDMTYVVVILAG